MLLLNPLKNLKAHFANRSKRLLKKAVRQLIRSKKYIYEPVLIDGKLYSAKREWQERWACIEHEIVHYEIKSLLDIGCAEGFFARLAAEKQGVFSIGIEFNNKRLWLGELSRMHDDVANFAIVKALMTPESIASLPRFEMVILLSVLHHVIRQSGRTGAIDFLSSIRLITGKRLIFEMGTSEETKNNWAGLMPTGNEGQFELLKSLLQEAGFQDVRQLASTPGIMRDADRLIVSAAPGML